MVNLEAMSADGGALISLGTGDRGLGLIFQREPYREISNEETATSHLGRLYTHTHTHNTEDSMCCCCFFKELEASQTAQNKLLNNLGVIETSHSAGLSLTGCVY